MKNVNPLFSILPSTFSALKEGYIVNLKGEI